MTCPHCRREIPLVAFRLAGGCDKSRRPRCSVYPARGGFMVRASRLMLCSAGLVIGMLMGTPDAQVLPITMEELVRDAAQIARGEFVAQRVERNSNGLIVTIMSFRVDRTLKGPPAGVLELEFLGGTIGDESLTVSHSEMYEVGDRSILFLNGLVNSASPLVGMEQGQLGIESSNAEDVVVLHDGSVLQTIDQLGAVAAADPVPRVGSAPGRFRGLDPMTVRQLEENIAALVNAQGVTRP